MASFFELDRDEILFNGRSYLDYFNLYPNLSYTPTLAHLESLEEIAVLGSSQSRDGWQIAVMFDGLHFLWILITTARRHFFVWRTRSPTIHVCSHSSVALFHCCVTIGDDR